MGQASKLTSIFRQLGLELKGDSANVYWGAFDAIIKSDVSVYEYCVLDSLNHE